MKKIAMVSILLLVAHNAFAICDTWTQSRSSYTGSGSVSNTTVCGDDGWSFGSGNSYRQVSFNVTSVQNPSNWFIGSYVYFSSPGGTPSDNFEIDIDVTHPNYTVSRYTLMYWSGAYGDLTDCGIHYRYFSADVGDSVLITIRATNSGSATINVSAPRIYNCS